MRYLIGLMMASFVPAHWVAAQDVSSGPEKGAKVAALKVFDATGAHKDKEVNYAAERKQAPTIYLFIDAGQFDRPMNRFMKTLDGLVKKDFQEAYVVAVWLTSDTEATKRLLPRVQQSVQYEATALTLFDGPKEGPKGWHINGDARLTAIVVNKSRIVATFGYQSINETNVPQVRSALAMATEAGGKPATPAEQYKILRKESDRASSSGFPLTDAERLKFVGAAYKHRYALAQRFLKLAEKHPNDPIALDALMQAVWQVNGTPWPVELVGEDTARARAFELIQRDHIESDKLGPLCQRVSYGFCKEYETFLSAVLAKNPHREVQATACVSLGRFLNSRLLRLDLCKEQPDLAKDFAALFGREYLGQLMKQSRATALQDIEAIFEQAARKYSDVKLPGGETVADQAKAELFGIRHLSVGKEAPDIEGEDQDGKRFKLSDYRGKVVLLDFWSFV